MMTNKDWVLRVNNNCFNFTREMEINHQPEKEEKREELPLVFTAPPKEIHQARTTYLPTKHPRSPLQLVPFNQSWNLEHNEQVEEGN